MISIQNYIFEGPILRGIKNMALLAGLGVAGYGIGRAGGIGNAMNDVGDWASGATKDPHHALQQAGGLVGDTAHAAMGALGFNQNNSSPKQEQPPQPTQQPQMVNTPKDSNYSHDFQKENKPQQQPLDDTQKRRNELQERMFAANQRLQKLENDQMQEWNQHPEYQYDERKKVIFMKKYEGLRDPIERSLEVYNRELNNLA